MRPYILYKRDVKRSLWLFFHVNQETGCVEIRERFRALKCPECGRIDEFEALRNGLENDAEVLKGMPDFFGSYEDFPIVSGRARDVLERLPNVAVDYFPVPSNDALFVAIPRMRIYPTLESKAFNCIGNCNTCHRVKQCVWGSDLFPLPDNLGIAAFIFEEGRHAVPLWVISEQIKSEITRAKLKGCFFDPYFKVA